MNSRYPRFAVGFLLVTVLLLYPFGVYLLLDRFSVVALGAIFVVLAIGRLWLLSRARPWLLVTATAVAALFLAALAYTDSEIVLKLYPTLVNVGCLLVFALTLWFPPSMIERIAVLARMEMSAHGVAYTRVVTFIWCVFFALNGSISAWLALFGSTEAWALYTGVYAYIAMGLLLSGEYVFRGFYQRKVRGRPLQESAE